MAETIVQIKRSLTSNIPVTLKPGEFAYSSSEADSNGLTNGVLYIGGPTADQHGNSTNKYVIGGTKFTNLLDVTPGEWTSGKTLIVGEDGKINKIVTDELQGVYTEGTGETRLVIGGAETANQKVVIHDPYFKNEEGEIVPVAQYIDELVKGGVITIVAGDGIADITNENGTYTIALEPTGVTQGTYGSETKVPSFTVNQYGQITNIAEKTISTTMSVTNVEGDETATVNLISGKLIGADGLKVTQAAAGQAQIDVDETVVRTAGDQTISGTKTFNTLPLGVADQTDVKDADGSNELVKMDTMFSELVNSSNPVATRTVGGIPVNTDISNWTVKEILLEIVASYQPTTNVRVLSVTDAAGVFEVGTTKNISSVTVGWNKGSQQVTKAEVLRDGSPIGEAVVSSGTSVAVSTTTPAIGSSAGSVSITTRVTDNDEKPTIAGSGSTWTFVYPFYYGVAANAAAVTGTSVAQMTKVIQVKGNKTFAFTTNNQACVVAYPTSYGDLRQVMDQNNFDVTSTFKKQSVMRVTGLDGTQQNYNVYVNEPSTLSGFKFTFNF